MPPVALTHAREKVPARRFSLLAGRSSAVAAWCGSDRAARLPCQKTVELHPKPVSIEADERLGWPLYRYKERLWVQEDT
jgi:hypothetical protein